MTDGPILVASAVSYALKAAALVTPADLPRPTPCADWNVDQLLRHLCDSVAAFDEALATGQMSTADPGECPGPEPVELLRDRAANLLCTLFTCEERVIEVDGVPLPGGLALAVGAMEIAVHGWDIYVACGQGRAVPGAIAGPLARVQGQLVVDRQGLFASPVIVPPQAGPGDQLIAFLGRDPSARHDGYW